MGFSVGASLLDAVVLSIVSISADGTYGYKITQDVQSVVEVSESTLYPVLRRLQKNALLDVHDMQFDGRNRRYYKITNAGRKQLDEYRREWDAYANRITRCLKGETIL